MLPPPEWFLQSPLFRGLHPEFPLFATDVVARLQALKMACSWFSSTRKSCGWLYGFFSVMVCLHLLVNSAQWVNQRLVQRRLCPREGDVAIIGDGCFGCAIFPTRI